MNLQKEKFAKGYSVFALIRGLNFLIENDIRKSIKNNELTFPSFRVLWIMYFDSTITMKDLSYLIQTDLSNVFRQLIKLKDIGFVTLENGEDARTKKISLTKAGRKVVQDFINQNSTGSELQIVNLIEKIPKEDFHKFIEVLTLLSNQLVGENYSEFIEKSSKELVRNNAETA
ncbi:MarR family winged helix-turn-helix transcriptional regulator [Anaerobacillus sp. MEB173]|uniref:MarR family winged helix-turn-helix transcriptional regulator n=1 Tax=Anaerobacillus sp. MEB173 TaxID=3383345 RepID=UPI003F917444